MTVSTHRSGSAFQGGSIGPKTPGGVDQDRAAPSSDRTVLLSRATASELVTSQRYSRSGPPGDTRAGRLEAVGDLAAESCGRSVTTATSPSMVTVGPGPIRRVQSDPGAQPPHAIGRKRRSSTPGPSWRSRRRRARRSRPQRASRARPRPARSPRRTAPSAAPRPGRRRPIGSTSFRCTMRMRGASSRRPRAASSPDPGAFAVSRQMPSAWSPTRSSSSTIWAAVRSPWFSSASSSPSSRARAAACAKRLDGRGDSSATRARSAGRRDDSHQPAPERRRRARSRRAGRRARPAASRLEPLGRSQERASSRPAAASRSAATSSRRAAGQEARLERDRVDAERSAPRRRRPRRRRRAARRGPPRPAEARRAAGGTSSCRRRSAPC